EEIGFATTEAKISDTAGGFTGTLSTGDGFGSGLGFAPGEGGGSAGLLAVGAFSDDDGSNDRGAVWLLDLQTDGSVVGHSKISSTAGGFTGALATSDYFGSSIAMLGDLDGDGRLDMAVGAPGEDPGGGVWLLFLEGDHSVKSHHLIGEGKGGFRDPLGFSARLGDAVWSHGDHDGDGVGDVAVGADLWDDGTPGVTGAVWTLFLNAATWIDVGNALAGAKGDPILTGLGSLVVGEDMALMLTNTCPATTAYLAVGASALHAPFKGGVFVPDPILILPMGVGPSGELAIVGPWAPGVPPDVTLWFQYWMVDPAGPAGFSASNGLAATTP
ncbi:MAG: integrin alpha, partial [Planctomycetota bacterium]